MDKRPKTIIRRGAEGGISMGMLFIGIFALAVTSTGGLMSLLCLGLAIYVPFLAYRLLRRTYIDSHGLLTFAALWLEGIVMFACGSLLLAVIAYLFLRYISPDFVYNQMLMAAEIYKSNPSPTLQQLGQTIQAYIDAHMLPRSIDLAISMIWFGAFSGSLTSLAVAGIVKAKRVKNNQQR